MNKEESELGWIDVERLKASPWNRAADGNGEMKELADSIALHGILQPLLVREIPGKRGDEWEIVAGHRRWQAAKKAGLKKVPCIVSEIDDQEAKVAQITENLQRKNLNPMEEARSFATLCENNAHTPQTIADIVGKDVKYVYRSLKLLRLPEKARKALESGVISAAHGHQLARVGPKQIEAITIYAVTPGWKGEIPSVLSLKQEIARRVEKKLGQAPFVKDKEYAGKVACKGCPSNTANQEVLFDDAEEGFCTNNTCFAAKLRQFYKDLEDQGKKKWPRLKFIGTASAAYGEKQIIKGHVVVESADPKVKKAIEISKSPDVKGHEMVEGYGFGIIKPSNWGRSKVAKLVVLKKLSEKEAKQNGRGGYYSEPDPSEQYHWRFIRAYTESKCAKEWAVLEKAQAAYHVVEEDARKKAEAEWKKNKAAIVEEYKKHDEKEKQDAKS